MAYDLDKRTGRIAGQTARKVFDISVAVAGLAIGALSNQSSSKRRSNSLFPRKRRTKLW